MKEHQSKLTTFAYIMDKCTDVDEMFSQEQLQFSQVNARDDFCDGLCLPRVPFARVSDLKSQLNMFGINFHTA